KSERFRALRADLRGGDRALRLPCKARQERECLLCLFASVYATSDGRTCGGIELLNGTEPEPPLHRLASLPCGSFAERHRRTPARHAVKVCPSPGAFTRRPPSCLPPPRVRKRRSLRRTIVTFTP